MVQPLDLMLEAERRGILPPDRQSLLDEARRRGLIPGGADPEPKPPVITPGLRPGTPLPGGGIEVPLRDPTPEESQEREMGVESPSMSTAALRGMGRQLLDNMLAVPEVAANLAAGALTPQRGRFSPLEAIAYGLEGLGLDPFGEAEKTRAAVERGESVLDMPSAAEVTAGTQAVIGTPGAILSGDPRGIGDRYRDALERQQAVDIRFQEERPISTNVGEVGGDIATIMATRGIGRGATTGTMFPAAPKAAAAGAARAETVLGKIVQSTGRAIAKAGGRAAETGAEAAFLASLQDADPATVGAMAAGGQIIGDLSRPTFKTLAKPKTLMTAVGVATLVSLGIQQWTPGGLDRILPTIEAKNKEAFLALLLTGGAAALTGRPGTNFSPSPAFNELMNIVPRGVLESNLVSAVRDAPRAAPILTKFAEDPDYFGEKGKRLLTRALTVEGAKLDVTINSLMDDREFRNRFNLLQTQQQP